MRRLRTNVTVGGVVLPAGTPDSHDLAERITNPAAWEVDVEGMRRAAAEQTAAEATERLRLAEQEQAEQERLAEEQRLRDEEQARLAEEQRLASLPTEAGEQPAPVDPPGPVPPLAPSIGGELPEVDKPAARRPRKATA